MAEKGVIRKYRCARNFHFDFAKSNFMGANLVSLFFFNFPFLTLSKVSQVLPSLHIFHPLLLPCCTWATLRLQVKLRPTLQVWRCGFLYSPLRCWAWVCSPELGFPWSPAILIRPELQDGQPRILGRHDPKGYITYVARRWAKPDILSSCEVSLPQSPPGR